MSWITPLPAQTPYEALLAHRPELLARYRAFYRTLWNEERVPRRMLELCRLRVAAIHECAAELAMHDAGATLTAQERGALVAGNFSAFTLAEQAALALAEALPYGHHHINDEQVERVRSSLGDAGAVALLTAISFFDVSCRLKLVLDVPAAQRVLTCPPLLDGALP